MKRTLGPTLLITTLLAVTSCSVPAQPPSGVYLSDPGTGCRVWVAGGVNPSDSITISWDGPCDQQLASGKGTLVWRSKGKEVSRYTGTMRRGLPNGVGTYRLAGGMIQEGHFIDGVLNGPGKITFSDGVRKLEGNFSDGEILNLDSPYLRRLQRKVLAHTDPTDMYVNDRGSKDLLYAAVVPQGPVRGVLVLLPGTWDRVEYVLSNNKTLCQLAVDKGLAVLVPSVNQRLVLKGEVLQFLNQMFTDAITRYQLPKDKFVLGGFSMGGLFALRYTELALQDSSQTRIVPRAVYSVDGPMDLADMYGVQQRAFERSPQADEPRYALHELEQSMGGTPDKFSPAYVQQSAYSRSEPDGGNIRYLRRLPVRIYNDVDVNWWLTNRGADLYDMNALDQSAAINALHRLGNPGAEFINALGKGYRLDGGRHPHSWSIVDAPDCLQWILNALR